MEFEWDERKNKSNISRHGIDFNEAKEIFKGKNIMPISEERLKQIESIKDEDIDFSDIPELDDEFFENAAMVIRIPNGIKIIIAPETWHALAKSKEGLKYHINQIKLALKSYSVKQIA